MIKNLLIQVTVFFLIFQLLSWYKTSDMLSTDSAVESSPVLMTTAGEEIRLVAKDKNLVLYFFAPWCSICHASIDNLQKLYEKNEHLDVIAVGLDYTSEQEIYDFVQQHQLTFPIALGNEQIKQQFKVYAYPSYYIIDEHNSIKSKSVGYSTELGLYLRSF
ncbi:TlpA disulfide reductase family protein [Thalassotalea piscium]|uniref:Peroxiredoxin n=1 Tax=Thalassotalea piscium TaxID=1230533 RepID=A0A7X0TSP8_9GAMM|nr:TlpA disulfide reductase family protein [Thalassotalea piscium]MBB6542354.1 peroxiredoxin [Thalassotalea piscium]